jgi:predicted dehydrogenase
MMTPSTEHTVRVGVIGLSGERSWAARAHVPALAALDGFELVGVANSTLRSSIAAAEQFGVPTPYATARELVASPDIDLVAITVKVPAHRELVEMALAERKMVYCEWPLGTSSAEAASMADDARSAGVRVGVGLQARYAPAIRYLRDLVRDGYVGDVLSTTLVGSGDIVGAGEAAHLAYVNERRNGANVLTIPFAHTIDAVQWALGDITEVSATLATRRPAYTIIETGEVRHRDVHDQIALTGRIRGGTVLAAHYRGGTARGTNLLWEINGTEGDLRVVGPTGHAQLAPLRLLGGRGSERAIGELVVPSRYSAPAPDARGPGVAVAGAYEAFMRSEHPDFDDAVRLHRLLDAIERSAADGERQLVTD